MTKRGKGPGELGREFMGLGPILLARKGSLGTQNMGCSVGRSDYMKKIKIKIKEGKIAQIWDRGKDSVGLGSKTLYIREHNIQEWWSQDLLPWFGK